MIFPFLLIWILLILLFKFQLKQTNESAVIRGTLFSLLAYIVIDCRVNEGLELGRPTDEEIQNSDIALEFNKSYKKNSKKACKNIKTNEKILINNFNQQLSNVNTAPKLSKDQLKKGDPTTIYNTDYFNAIQQNYNDIIVSNTLHKQCKSTKKKKKKIKWF